MFLIRGCDILIQIQVKRIFILYFLEQCRVVRVLNLWQKNAVFPVEVIQPLLDLAAEPNNVDLVLAG